jgi:hypothetical protein
MRTVVTVVLAASAALALAPAAGADTPQPVVSRISIATAGITGVRTHHGYSMRVDTIALDKLAGAKVKLRCLGCKTRRLGHPRHHSRDALRYENLGWLVGSSNYIEVDKSQSGYVGRWLRLGLRRVRHPRRGTSCFALPESGVHECLLKLKTGCLVEATAHSACPSGTPIQPVDFDPAVSRLPHTSINSGPTGLSNSRIAKFTYSSDVGTDYQCKLDEGDWLVCPNGQEQYEALSDDDHVFEVRAVLNGQPDPSPAIRKWTVDATPPHTAITAGPSGAVQGASGTFFYASSEGGTRFDCDLDFQGWKPCNGGHATFSYSEAGHSLAVRALDAAGNVDPSPPTTTWRRFPDDGTPFVFDDQDQGFFRNVGDEADWHNTGSGGKTYWYFAAYPHCDGADISHNSANWDPSGLTPGFYDVYAWIPSNTPSAGGPFGADLSSSVHYSVIQGDGSQVDAFVSQASHGGSWLPITSFVRLDGTTYITAYDDDAIDAACDNKIVAADALKLVYRSP